MRCGTGREGASAGTLVALFAVPWLLACAQIAGTNDYRVGAEPQQNDPPPPAPFLTGGAECEACIKGACATQLSACDADQTCSSWLADIQARSDPLSAYARYQIEDQLAWQSDHDDQPYNATIANLRTCAQGCLEPCKIGQDFSCVGDFDWDLPPPAVLQTQTTEGGAAVTSQVSACLSVDQCETPLASQETNKAGFAELDSTPDAEARGPIGYLHFVGPDPLPWQYVQTRPLANNDFIPLDYIKEARFREWDQAFGQTFDGNEGVVIVIPLDCEGINAKQVSLEAWYYVESKLTFCDHCFYAYGQDVTETPSAELKAFETTARGGYIANVAPGVVYVALRRVSEPKDIVSVARLLVRGGEVALVRAYPSSRQEVSSFPDPRN